jgi:MarR family transcriptional regulator, organic hydroperoxide resistance regulator
VKRSAQKSAKERIRSKPKARGKFTDEDRFPPLSISAGHFLHDGSDREFRHLIYSLLSFSALMIRHRECYASYIGVTGSQYSMMAVLAEAGGATVRQVASHMRVASQFVTAEINKLIRGNIVEKRTSNTDRRSVNLSLTEKGRNLLRELGPIRRVSNDLMYGSLDEQRAQALQGIIDALIGDAEAALHALDAPEMRGRRAASAQVEKTSRQTTQR